MPAADGWVSGIQTNLYVKAAGPDAADSAADVEALAVAANLLKYVDDIGDQGQEPNPIRFTNFGEKAGRSIPGIPDTGTFAFTLNLDYNEASHKPFLGTAATNFPVGTALDIVVATVTSAGDESFDYLRGKVSGITKLTPKDAQAQLTVSVELEQAPDYFDHS